MNKSVFSCFATIMCMLASCSSDNSQPATDIDAARQFVDNIWHNDFKKAEELLLKDVTNKQTFDGFEVYYKRLPKDQLEKYKTATIVLNNVTPVNDSVSLVNYSPDFNKAEKNELKIVRTNGHWYIDLKPEIK